MSVTRQDVEKVAKLARLSLSSDELASLEKDLNRCFKYFDHLREVDTEGVEPLHHLHDMFNVLDDDKPGECLTREVALRDAPDRTDEFFRLPRVID